MNFSTPFIARPIATALLAVAVLLSGLFGYLRLPVSALPEVDFPTIEVTTTLPGASPETVALLVAVDGKLVKLTAMSAALAATLKVEVLLAALLSLSAPLVPVPITVVVDCRKLMDALTVPLGVTLTTLGSVKVTTPVVLS